jgi:hypothetical protein
MGSGGGYAFDTWHLGNQFIISASGGIESRCFLIFYDRDSM